MPLSEPLSLHPEPPALPELQACVQAFEAALATRAGDLSLYRETLACVDRCLEAAFTARKPMAQIVYARSWAMDRLLRGLWRHLLDAPARRDLALVAVGGYGRAELLPRSDIDLLILVDASAGDRHDAALGRFVTALWDLGLDLGHSVRTVAECIVQAREDITVMTNLIESRCIDGSEALYAAMLEGTAPDRMWDGRTFFEAKLEEQHRRHRRFHDTAYNLEPNVKENPGGLRDIQMVGWVAKRHFGARTLHDLQVLGFLTEEEYRTLVDGQAFLWRIRFALHSLNRRKEDRLLFDYQRNVAERLGHARPGEDANRTVERFMKDYYRTVLELNRLNELLLQLFREQILHGTEDSAPQPLNRRFQVRRGFLEVVDERVFTRYPFALLELFLLMAQHPELEGVRATTIRLVRRHRHRIDARFRHDLRCRSLFMELVRQPRGVTHELRRMNRYGVLAAYIPAFGRIVGQMQFDLFHAYTVDEHTLFVVRNIRRMSLPEFAHELPLPSQVTAALPKLELLILAGLFHDIAKGRGGDHSELGAEEARAFCRLHGLGDYDTELVAWLVRHHLLMSTTAQHRDISDPEVVLEFATRVGTPERLNYLYALTVADIRGTNPGLWTTWKDALLRELYLAARTLLRQGLARSPDIDQILARTRNDARERLVAMGYPIEAVDGLWLRFEPEYFLRHSVEEIVWHTDVILRREPDEPATVAVRDLPVRGGTEIFVYMPTRKGLFEQVTGLLDRLGLNTIDARILTTHDGWVLDTYLVTDQNDRPIADPHRQEAIRDRLVRSLATPAPPGDIPRLTLPRKYRHFPTQTRIHFDRDPRGKRTIMELFTTDRPGLLSLVGHAITRCGADLENARIATFGHRVEDVFYLSDTTGGPITDPERLDCIRRVILAGLGEREERPGPPEAIS
ncbi:MAG: [protein-PII] uridylyltransferase [Gammaproteobacteria bacterium]|nr:MAG: [protein-PII] uridylyltransferase [Gammaproteobacteria bacterium]